MKLASRAFAADVIARTLDHLAEQGLQSDGRYADGYARSRAEKGYGHRRIIEELKQRGISREDLPDLSCYDWSQSIHRVYTKKYGTRSPLAPGERARRENFLRVRGFSSDEIRQLFRSLPSSGDTND